MYTYTELPETSAQTAVRERTVVVIPPSEPSSSNAKYVHDIPGESMKRIDENSGGYDDFFYVGKSSVVSKNWMMQKQLTNQSIFVSSGNETLEHLHQRRNVFQKELQMLI